MIRNKIVLLSVAVAIAVAGTGLTALYVKDASSPAVAQEDLVKVLTATSVIPVGETAAQAQSEGKLALTPVPRSSVVTGAVTSIDTMGDQVALAPIYPGEQILALKFGTTAASERLLPVPKGQLGVSVELNDPGRVAGFVTPGSHVAIFVDFVSGNRTRVLVSDALVLGVGPTSAISPKDAANADPSGTVVPQAVLTVALDTREADQVINATVHQVVWFGLLSTGLKLPFDVGITYQDLLK